MADRPLFGREAMLDVCNGAPLYDEAATRELLMRVGPPPEAAERVAAIAAVLSRLGADFAFNLWREIQASTPVREREAKRLAAACQKVLTIVGVDGGGELLPMFGPGGLFAAASLRGEPKERHS